MTLYGIKDKATQKSLKISYEIRHTWSDYDGERGNDILEETYNNGPIWLVDDLEYAKGMLQGLNGFNKKVKDKFELFALKMEEVKVENE